MFQISSELNTYIRVKIGESKSKEEEDIIVKQDIISIQKSLQSKSLTNPQTYELILRIIYAEMLGHNTDFAHFFIVNSVQNKSYRVKRIAYLACITLLDENSPFRIMMVASLQKDLENSCLYNKIIALNCLSKILCSLNASAFIDILMKMLVSQHVVIRKKSILAVIRLEEVLPGAVEGFDDVLEKALRDKEASIMMAVLPYFARAVKKEGERYKSKLYIFLQIFQQILERKLSKDYDYDDHPAPWAVIKILQIFCDLCKNDKKQSELVYNSLKIYVKSFSVLSTDVDVVLLFQTVITLMQIFPKEELIEICLEKLEILRMNGFLKRNNSILLVLKIISKIVEIDTKYIEDYQMLLLDCLDSTDETIKHLTINILFKNITAENIEIVVKKIQEFIENAIDLNFKNLTINKLYRIIEQKAPNPSWFLKKSLEIIDKGSHFISEDIINSIIKNIVEIFLYEENDKQNIGLEFLEIFKGFIESKNLNDSFISIFIWFLGEYFEIIENFFPSENLLELINYLIKHKFTNDATVSYFFTALQKIKIKSENSHLVSEIKKIMVSKLTNENKESQIRLREYILINKKTSEIFKSDNIDLEFNFLSSYIKENLRNGGKKYKENFHQKKKNLESDLVIKYTKKQKENNMKKNMEGAEKEFKYKGKAKWSHDGFKGGEDINQTNIHGLKEKDKKKKEIKFTFNNDDKNETKDDENEKKEKKNEKKKKKRKNKNKKMKVKTKIASSLFGATKLNIKKKEKDSLFFKKEQSAKKQKKKRIEKKNEENEKVEIIDFLSLDTKPKNQKVIKNKNEEKKKILISPFKISLEQYEEFWEKFENFEIEKNLNKNLTYKEMQNCIRDLGFYIVDVMESEFVSSAKKGEEIILLYLSYDSDGDHDFIFRGKKNIVLTIFDEIKN